jgi:hypothetical protein
MGQFCFTEMRWIFHTLVLVAGVFLVLQWLDPSLEKAIDNSPGGQSSFLHLLDLVEHHGDLREILQLGASFPVHGKDRLVPSALWQRQCMVTYGNNIYIMNIQRKFNRAKLLRMDDYLL